MSLGEKLWRRKKVIYTDETVRVELPPGSRIELKIQQPSGNSISVPGLEGPIANIVEEHMSEMEPVVLNPRYPLFSPRLNPHARPEIAVRKFVTPLIAESAALDQGVIMIDKTTASRMGFPSGCDAKVSFAGRSARMKLMTSKRLNPGEVELCRADMDELGISKGASDWLEIQVVVSKNLGKRSRTSKTGRKVRVAQRMDKPDASGTALDGPLPYEVETGWRPFKKLRRK